MNESDLENELRALRPAEPSPALRDRIADDLQGVQVLPRAGVIAAVPPQSWLARFFPPLGWIVTGAAAAWIATMAFRTADVTTTPEVATGQSVAAATPEVSSAPLGEVETSRELVTATEEELLLDADQEPARRMRLTFIERHVWTDPDTGDHVEIEVPREDILLVPVAMQ